MSILKKCFEKKARVKVLIRSLKTLRGFCVGQLVAFDKHFNLVLYDVEEEYHVWEREFPEHQGQDEKRVRETTRDKKGKEKREMKGSSSGLRDQTIVMQGPPKEKNLESGRRLVKKKRRVKQLFIKGDNVVIITPVEQE